MPGAVVRDHRLGAGDRPAGPVVPGRLPRQRGARHVARPCAGGPTPRGAPAAAPRRRRRPASPGRHRWPRGRPPARPAGPRAAPEADRRDVAPLPVDGRDDRTPGRARPGRRGRGRACPRDVAGLDRGRVRGARTGRPATGPGRPPGGHRAVAPRPAGGPGLPDADAARAGRPAQGPGHRHRAGRPRALADRTPAGRCLHRSRAAGPGPQPPRHDVGRGDPRARPGVARRDGGRRGRWPAPPAAVAAPPRPGRDRILRADGWEVVRFPVEEVDDDPTDVAARVATILARRRPATG